MSQEIHCFHELFLRGSATVVVFPRDLINLITQYFSRVLKNITDVCRVYWCWDSLVRFARLVCLRTESFSPPKWFVSDKSFPINDLCRMRVWQVVIRLQIFLDQTRTFPSCGQRIYSQFTLASYGREANATKASVSLQPSKHCSAGLYTDATSSLPIYSVRAFSDETSSLTTCSVRALFWQIEIWSGIYTLYFNCK